MARTIEIRPLLDAIEATQDDDLLIELYEILGLPSNGQAARPSGVELAEMKLAEEEYERGEYSTHEEVMEEARKWISK